MRMLLMSVASLSIAFFYSYPGRASVFYLAIRPDGIVGTGSAADPYDASMVNGISRFDVRMREITQNLPPADDGSPHEIRLAQGIYQTWGDDGNYAVRGAGFGFFLRPNTKLVGAGMGRTIIKLIGVKYIPYDPTWGRSSHAVVSSGSYGGSPSTGGGTTAVCNNVTVEDLTVDCNTPEFHPAQENNTEVHDYAIDGVKLNGSNCTIRRVEVLHALGTTGQGPFTESAAISIAANGAPSGNGLIESCVVDKSIGDYVNGIVIHNEQFGNSNGTYATVRYCTVRDNPTWNAYSGSTGLNGQLSEFYGNTATNVGNGFRWDTNNLYDIRLKHNTFIGSNFGGTAAANTWRTSRAIELSPGSPRIQTLGNFQVEGNYFRFPGDGKGFIHFQYAPGPGLVSPFNGLTLKNNTFESDLTTNTICALDIDDGVEDHPEDDTYAEDTLFGDPNNGYKEYNTLTLRAPNANPHMVQNIQFLGGNTLLGSSSSKLWRQQSLSIPQPNITANLTSSGAQASVWVSPANSYNVQVGTLAQFAVYARAGASTNGNLFSFNCPKGSLISPSLPRALSASDTNFTFSWTPTIDQVGLHTISFIAENLTSQNTKFAVVSVNVLSNPAIRAINWTKQVSVVTESFPAGTYIEKGYTGINNSTAISSQRITGDGSISFRFARLDGVASVGLTSYLSPPLFSGTSCPEFALVSKGSGQVWAYENSYRVPLNNSWITTQVNLGAFTTNNIFTISREGGTIRYYKDSVLIRSVSASENLPLFAQFAQSAIYDANKYTPVTDCTIKNGAPASEVTWGNLQGMSTIPTNAVEVGTSIKKTGTGGDWNSEALSTKRILGDGFVSFRFGETDKNILVGLSSDSPNTDPLGPDYAIIARPGSLVDIVDFWGNPRGTWSRTAGDVFRIERKAGLVNYYKNNSLMISSVWRNTLPLMVECNALESGASAVNCIIGGAETTKPVTWQFPYNVVSSNESSSLGSTLEKTSGGANWEAEAVSTERFEGNGYVQFRFAQTNKVVAMSLAARDRDVGSYNCEYLLMAQPFVPELNGPGVVVVDYGTTTPPDGGAPYNGIYRGAWPYTPSDSFMIAKENGVVNYYKNGSLMVSSNHRETQPLMVLCQAFDINAKVSNCVYSDGTPFQAISWSDWTNANSHLTLDTSPVNRGSKVIKTTGGDSGWDYVDTTKVMNGDGTIQFQFGPGDKPTALAIGTTNNSLFFQATLNPENGNPSVNFQKLDGGQWVFMGYVGNYTPDMVFTITRKNGAVRYFVNATEVPIAVSSSTEAPLKVRCAIQKVGGCVRNANYAGFSSP